MRSDSIFQNRIINVPFPLFVITTFIFGNILNGREDLLRNIPVPKTGIGKRPGFRFAQTADDNLHHDLPIPIIPLSFPLDTAEQYIKRTIGIFSDNQTGLRIIENAAECLATVQARRLICVPIVIVVISACS
jgi:hypothetical protein